MPKQIDGVKQTPTSRILRRSALRRWSTRRRCSCSSDSPPPPLPPRPPPPAPLRPRSLQAMAVSGHAPHMGHLNLHAKARLGHPS